MRNSFLSFLRLTRAEKVFFCHALLLLTRYRIRLQTTSLEKLIELVRQETQCYRQQKKTDLALHRLSRLIQIAAKLVPFSTCLSNALAGQVLFTANNHPTTLHIGVRNTPEKGFEAHAWLTLDGAILLGHLPDLRSYKELPSIQKDRP
ncbi:MAG: lasso peptide biosynthesis B2 protein [Proteobacteria bacterium]|nr:lasso peptide biosynthesis B2 protein [Pseudomonadota bacterium]MBU1060278.1 lasso peptide biosynthesis B2 protein [Pseudomonadota bacterium]